MPSSEIASLKLELAEAKASANQASVQPPTHSHASAASYRPSPSGNSNSRGKKASRHLCATQRPKIASSTAAPRDNLAKSSNHGSANHTTRIGVEGPRARRVWNTYVHASTKSVENAIPRFCKIEGLNIKRKTHTNNRTGKLNWWFVIHGEENTLCELESKWETLHTQTSWVLEKCHD